MKIKTEKLTRHALNWAVAKCEHDEGRVSHVVFDEDLGVLEVPHPDSDVSVRLNYSSNWNKAGPIIEREKIEWKNHDVIVAGIWYRDGIGADEQRHKMTGKTPLEAAMRTFVASKRGAEVEVPDEIAN